MLDVRIAISAALLTLGGFLATASADGIPKGPSRDRYVACCNDQEFKEYNWSGVFIGGHIAGALSQADWALTAPTEGFRHNDTSFGGGVQAAVQRQWGRTVVGVEASFTWIDSDASTPSLLAPGTTISSNVSDLIIVAAKLGYAQDRWLAFSKFGYASADFTLQSTTAGITTSSTERQHGWMMGIGMDYAVTDRIILGVEYDWSFFSLDSRTLGARLASGSDDIQMITGRLMFKFGSE